MNRILLYTAGLVLFTAPLAPKAGDAKAAPNGVAAGKQAFARCSACHSLAGKNGVGPSLNGVVGRKAGSVPGFRYSPALSGANIVWNETKLDAFLAKPSAVVAGTRMVIPVPDAKDRAAIIAYLRDVGP